MRYAWTAFALLVVGNALAQDALPITRVVLFRSGVGYIERLGQVQGEASLTLSLRETQMNDLLKSLVLVDFDGGQILPVQYAPRDPLTRTLSAFAINLADNPSMATLLNRLRGAPVELQTEKETLQGAVLSVETRKLPADETTIEQAFVNLMTPEGMRSVALSEVRSLRVRDERLQQELQNALNALSAGLDNTRKTVELRLRGQGNRRVLVGYLTEMPLWKMTYRLVIGEGEPLLQGWAIVENTTDEDWRDVRVELVSGRPVSFIQNLYEPVYPQRPRVQTQTDEALLPAPPEAAMRKQEEAGIELAMPRTAPGAPGFGGFGGRAAAPALRDADAALRESILEMATGQERGALFDYRIEQPVTIMRQQSAMLPVVSRAVQAETVSLFNPANHPRHPFFGVQLTNTTDLTLMEGPVTVYLNGSYGGDAQLTTLEPKGERVLTFALDLGVEVVRDRENLTSQQASVKIANGVLEQRVQVRRENEYRLQNRDSKPRTLIVEQPIDGEWELVQPRNAERSANFHRFRVRLEPQQTQTLKVVEQATEQETVELLQADDELLRVFVQDRRLSEAVRQALASILNRRRAIASIDSEIRQQEATIRAIADDQARIRENMKQLDRNSALYRQYVQKLTEQEREIEQARRAIERLREQKARAQRELSEYVAGLNL
ncbi:MAG: hypothetical protein NZM28_03045 [Fimbriimonadales bacterium]|nr:hypothetical protein [Fimbriimonadales bacterium]